MNAGPRKRAAEAAQNGDAAKKAKSCTVCGFLDHNSKNSKCQLQKTLGSRVEKAQSHQLETTISTRLEPFGAAALVSVQVSNEKHKAYYEFGESCKHFYSFRSRAPQTLPKQI
jgi:hypothetical protein